MTPCIPQPMSRVLPCGAASQIGTDHLSLAEATSRTTLHPRRKSYHCSTRLEMHQAGISNTQPMDWYHGALRGDRIPMGISRIHAVSSPNLGLLFLRLRDSHLSTWLHQRSWGRQHSVIRRRLTNAALTVVGQASNGAKPLPLLRGYEQIS